MDNKYDTELCGNFPELFIDRHADMKTTAMCWGFDVGNGWINILRTLCGSIQGHINWRRDQIKSTIEYNERLANMKRGDFAEFDEYSKAWKPGYQELRRTKMLEEAPREMPEEIAQVTVNQVKEKFGTLRFYYSGGDSYIDGLVAMAESMSANTCEECGAPGKTVGGGWLTTLCEKHANERNIYVGFDDENNKDAQ